MVSMDFGVMGTMSQIKIKSCKEQEVPFLLKQLSFRVNGVRRLC